MMVATKKHRDATAFYVGLSELASLAPSPAEVLQKVVELWTTTMQCKWSSLRLRRNDPFAAWELVATSPENYIDNSQPKHLSVEGQRPVVEYAYRLQTPQFIENQNNWEAKLDDEAFAVTGLESYKRLGASCFLTIPFPIARGEKHQILVPGSICCHFGQLTQLREIRHLYSDEALISMANLSATIIRDAFEREHFRLLIELNQLASDALIHISKNPRSERATYVRGIANLARSAVSCRAVSLFYRIPFLDEIGCVFSTGLIEATTGQVVAANKLGKCRYKKHESRTGQVFASGKPVFLSGDDRSNAESKFVEILDDGSYSEGSALIHPIPSSESSKEGPADGVIRCIGRLPRQLAADQPDFDVLEVQTLEFIARQVAPVLRTLATRIRREDQVNTLRHDLLVPMCMIRDGVEELQDTLGDEPSFVGLDEHLIPNLTDTSGLLIKLIDQLDDDPSKFEFKPEPTFLEADIIARQRNMLRHYARSANDMAIEFGNFGRIPRLRVDKNMVERAFFNLIVNAVKYGTEGTVIKIQPRVEFVRVEGQARSALEYHIDFENFGPGITNSESERIFDLYFRSPAAVSRESGLGLGLYIARACIEKNGGKLILSSLVNPTRFTVIFPSECRA